MVRGEEVDINTAKRSYRLAKEEGNRQEEARWANVIGNILKNRGEYVEALKWLRLDYEVSNKYLPEKQLLATCQSMGEVYLRLGDYSNALKYQKKHLDLAEDAKDLVEQQRASTQLGRTYHELFLKSDNDPQSIRNAKKYFESAMNLAKILKENPLDSKSFLKEYIDAHNNIGMLELDLDNFDVALKFLTKGLEICDEEEVAEDDDGRSRLHHNLGNVYLELREFDKAHEHIQKDIIICKRIEHCQGEAKGYINLGEMHYRHQQYDKAICCYRTALNLAKSMEDEGALVDQIDENIEVVNKAINVMDELTKEEQHLKKLVRNTIAAKGTPQERKFLLQQNSCLDRLIEKSATIFYWDKHREFAKEKTRIASELCDKEKISDAFLVVGESYHKVREFREAIKWYIKSWEGYKSIGNLEGQALAKINIGNVLDSKGDWTGALEAFEEGYRIAVEAKLPSVQLSALENMHYSHMIRFNNVEEARTLQSEIDELKQSKAEPEANHIRTDYWPETDTEVDDNISDNISNADSRVMSKCNSNRSAHVAATEDFNDDVPLISLIQSSKRSLKSKAAQTGKYNSSTEPDKALSKSLSKSTNNQQTVVGRKRVRIILSDDEGDMNDEVEGSAGRLDKWPVDTAASDEFKSKIGRVCPDDKPQDFSPFAPTSPNRPSSLINIEESTCSYKLVSPKITVSDGKVNRSLSNAENVGSGFAGSSLKCDIKLHSPDDEDDVSVCHTSYAQLNLGYVTFKIDNSMIHLKVSSFLAADKRSMESIKVELACLYYLQLPVEKRSKGLLPIIQKMECGGRPLESLEIFDSLRNQLRKLLVDVFIDGWVQKRLMKLYIGSCKELSEEPNMKLLKKLYISEVEDEVNMSDCELQDISVAPLLNALHTHKGVAMLDLSHNLLGNTTMEKFQQFFSLSDQKYGGLTLDLHCNRFGPTALFQICECPVLFTRLEVLNISGNRLTDACGSYLSTILEKCKALYSLNVERCSITSRTIQKVADSLDSGSVLSQLLIGYNNPISGNAISNLLSKLATLKRFSDLGLNGLKLSKPVIDGLCRLAKTSCLSRLMLEGTGIGTDGALELTQSLFSSIQEPLKLDLSYCGIASTYVSELNTDLTFISGILELNLGGNPIMHEGADALASLLMNPHCCLKVLILNKCQLGVAGILQVLQALAVNDSLEELNLADNADLDKQLTLPNDLRNEGTEFLEPNPTISESSHKPYVSKELNDEHGLCAFNSDCNNLEVADSEDDEMRVDTAASRLNDSSASSCQRNSSLECQLIQDLSTAIGIVKNLQFLDLSNNGFSKQASEALYNAWSSGSRVGLAWRHIENKIVHFSVEENKCCSVKPCCRKE
ncbi:Leucine-rich repeat, ribonuclease inhibitor subtype [Corchorus capsularis]|uniref:Protein TONSOKU n=1 Tax=Corchorus capsularis TaxID=210143 RepID=A0A1R3GG86_COCAP|nr:Leucine-rich repeat, ribonuclease inhibitor subtype [Corchorus capsularis]